MAKRYYSGNRGPDERPTRRDPNDRGEYSESSRDRREDRSVKSDRAMPNHEREKFNDEHRSEKDEVPRGMYRGALTNAELYMGMPTGMRGGLENGQMIKEDHRAIANLPQEVMIKPYPMTGPYLPEDLEDSIHGVDAQMDYDDNQRRAHFYPKKV